MKQRPFFIFLYFIFFSCALHSQKGVFELGAMENLLSPETKNCLDGHVAKKKVVFLGESEHHIGSDFLAKTQFVKYLVTEHNYKNIVFESDFFALYFEHDKKNVFPMWSKSSQCQELFKFLEEHNVTIWGLDNQFSTAYSFDHFSVKLFSFLNQNNIIVEERFKTLVTLYMKNGKSFFSKASKADFSYMMGEIDALLRNELVHHSPEWEQFIGSFKSVLLMGNASSKKDGKKTRDSQMAKNLNFITGKFPNEKFLVWAANAHISKLDEDFMDGQTMGFQYAQLNPGISYHVAFAPIRLPYRSKSFITSQKNDSDNLLYLLPDIENNYLIDSKLFVEANQNKDKNFKGMFGMHKEKIPWFKHFDMLVFIANGEISHQ